jgi:hypothetical protein
MGDATSFLNELRFPLSDAIAPARRDPAALHSTIDALVTPDIDESLDEQPADRVLERVQALGPWWAGGPY